MCRRSADGGVKFIDFQFDIDYYGAVVFCEDCIKECMGLLDMVPKVQVLEAKAYLATAEEELEVVRNELDKYKFAIAGLRAIGVTGLVDDNESEELAEAGGDSKQTDSGSMETESDSDGSDSVGGLEDISIFTDRSNK
jgi:hypothetical protein